MKLLKDGKNDEMGDPAVTEREVEAQDQRVMQARLVVGPVDACVHRDIAAAIPGLTRFS